MDGGTNSAYCRADESWGKAVTWACQGGRQGHMLIRITRSLFNPFSRWIAVKNTVLSPLRRILKMGKLATLRRQVPQEGWASLMQKSHDLVVTDPRSSCLMVSVSLCYPGVWAVGPSSTHHDRCPNLHTDLSSTDKGTCGTTIHLVQRHSCLTFSVHKSEKRASSRVKYKSFLVCTKPFAHLFFQPFSFVNLIQSETSAIIVQHILCIAKGFVLLARRALTRWELVHPTVLACIVELVVWQEYQ